MSPAEHMPYVDCIILGSLMASGEQITLRYSFATADHEQAARQAFRAVGDGGGSGIRVREIVTYDGVPSRRWWPRYDVTPGGDVQETT